MDTTPYLLTNNLTTGIATWFNTNIYFDGFFKAVFNYCRIDIPISELTAVSIYLLPNNNRQKPGKIIGKVKIAVSFSLRDQREDKALNIYKILDTIRSQLITNPTYLQTYLSTNWTPGLQMIQSQNDIDFGAIENSLLKGDGTVTVPIVMDYQVDILLNQRALWAQGNDFFSPVTPVYTTIEEVDVIIITRKFNS